MSSSVEQCSTGPARQGELALLFLAASEAPYPTEKTPPGAGGSAGTLAVIQELPPTLATAANSKRERQGRGLLRLPNLPRGEAAHYAQTEPSSPLLWTEKAGRPQRGRPSSPRRRRSDYAEEARTNTETNTK